jgi:hypothetical protein
MPLFPRIALAFGALLSARAVLATDVRVDVVVDFNGGGYKTVRPSPDKPAYYLPLVVGYKQIGDVAALQKEPPPAGQVQRMLTKALFDQGYRVATRQFAPSLVLVSRWGVMSPLVNRNTERLASIQQAPMPIGDMSGPHMGSPGMMNMGTPGSVNMTTMDLNPLAIPQSTQAETLQMLSLVAGDTLNDRGRRHNVDDRNVPMAEILEMVRAPRYFIMVTAYAYQDLAPFLDDWVNHRPPPRKRPRLMPLWEAHISTELAGYDFEEVLPTLISTAAPMLGHETLTPQLVTASSVPMGRVEVGTPVMK